MAWCKSGTRTPGSGTRTPLKVQKWDPGPPWSLKVGPQDPLQNLKVGSQDPLQSLKVGLPHVSLMNSFFFRIFIRLFYLFIFVSFLNKIQKNINCEKQKSIVNTKKDKRLLLKHGARPWTWTPKNMDPEKPEPRKTWTQKNLGPEKSGPWKTWTHKNLDSEKPGPWKFWTMKNAGNNWIQKKRLEDHMV